MYSNSEIKKRIAKFRLDQGYSQEEMANRLSISINSYRKIEKGETILVSKRLYEISDILNIAPEKLLLESDNTISILSQEAIERQQQEVENLQRRIRYLEQHIDLLNEKNSLYTKEAIY